MNSYDRPIFFHIPGAFERAKICMKLVLLYRTQGYMFKDNAYIGSVYGSPGGIWNGGRQLAGHELARPDLLYLKDFYNEYEITVSFTFTNSLIKDTAVYDTYCNQLLEIYNTGHNAIICNSPDLEKYIRDKYGNRYGYISSTTKRLTEQEEQRAEFESLKQQNLLNELKVERQRHIIMILGLGLFVVIIIGFFIILWFHRKRELEHKQFLLDNKLLKQQEELSLLREKEAVLREKDALMREELFKRMKVAEKLPILEHNQSIEEGKHIHLSETDWSEIRLMLDSSYPNFIKNLKDTCPTLSEKDINFCCLIKINLSLQSLADIYCISTNSISRKKLRLKEKLRLPKEESLSQYLKRLGSPV